MAERVESEARDFTPFTPFFGFSGQALISRWFAVVRMHRDGRICSLFSNETRLSKLDVKRCQSDGGLSTLLSGDHIVNARRGANSVLITAQPDAASRRPSSHPFSRLPPKCRIVHHRAHLAFAHSLLPSRLILCTA